MKLVPLIAAIAAALVGTAAQAAIISGSLGGNGIVVDTVNNTEWLRLDLTRGNTVAQALSTYGGLGFKYATQSQLNSLLDQFFTINGGDPGTRAGGMVFGATTTANAEAQWNGLFGLTYNSSGFRESLGFYDDGVVAASETWYGFNSNPQTFNSSLTQPVSDIGVFLVIDNAAKVVPEPGSLLLVALAGLALVGAGRKSRRG